MPSGNKILSLLFFTAPGLNFGAPLGDKSGNIWFLTCNLNLALIASKMVDYDKEDKNGGSTAP